MDTEERFWSLFQIDQQRIGALHTNMITIRGWTITLISAVAGFSLSQHHRSLLLVAMVGTILFGLHDVRYRSTQLLHASRANKIEEQLCPGVQTPAARSRRAIMAKELDSVPIPFSDLVLCRRPAPLVGDLNERAVS